VISLRTIKFVLWAVIAIFAVAAINISVTIVQRQNALQEVSRYNIAWAASQAVNEIVRLEQRITAFGSGKAGVDKDEVGLRFDIVQNRVNLLQDGSMAAFAAHNPDQERLVQELSATVADLQPLIDKIDRPESIERALALLAPLEGKLGRFAAAANNFGAEQVAEDQQQLLELHWVFSTLAGGLILCGIALVALLFFQNRLIARAHETLRAMTDDLQIAKEAAESASDAKSRFLATMSHELRTPLNAIIGFSDIIAQESLGPIGPRQYLDFARDILRSGRHMFDVVSDILTMAKLEAGQFEFHFEPLDLHETAGACVAAIKAAEIAKGRDVAFDASAQFVSLRADEKAVRQMLMNLLSNAVKFSAADTPIRVGCTCAPEGALWLSIIDRGIGMTKAEAELVVQPFQQADNGLSRKYEGSGLGLSIVNALIERHGGRLVIESEPGRGSRISLVFPREAIVPEPLAAVA
jgi:signal transduction histidine kinase